MYPVLWNGTRVLSSNVESWLMVSCGFTAMHAVRTASFPTPANLGLSVPLVEAGAWPKRQLILPILYLQAVVIRAFGLGANRLFELDCL